MKIKSSILAILLTGSSGMVTAASIAGVGIGAKGQINYSDISTGAPGIGGGLVFGSVSGSGPRLETMINYVPGIQYEYDDTEVEHGLLYSDIGVDWPFLKFGRIAIGPSLGLQNSLAEVNLEDNDKKLMGVGNMGWRYGISTDLTLTPSWIMQIRAENLTGFEQDGRIQLAVGIQQSWGAATKTATKPARQKTAKSKPEKTKETKAAKQTADVKAFTALKSGESYFIHLGVTDSQKETADYLSNKELLALGVPLTATSLGAGHRIFLGPLTDRNSIATLKDTLANKRFFRKSDRLANSEYKPPIHAVLPASGPYYYIELLDVNNASKVAKTITKISSKISGTDWTLTQAAGTTRLTLGPMTSKEQTILLAKSLKEDGYELKAFVRNDLLQ